MANPDAEAFKVVIATDTVTTEATYSPANWMQCWDIFKISTTYYILGGYSDGADEYTGVWSVNTGTNAFDLEDDYTHTNPSGITIRMGYAIIIGTDAYFLDMADNFPDADEVSIAKFDSTVPTLSLFEAITPPHYIVSTDRNLQGMAYDGSDILYFILKKNADSKNYLMTREISGAGENILGEYNISLMLDRNVRGTIPPFTLEKGFHISEDKVYQIPSNYLGRLNLISSFNFTDTIIAITDHFLIDNSGNIYEFVDLIAENDFSYLFLDYWKEDYPTLDMEYRSDKFSVIKGQFIQIIGYYSADDQDRLFKGTYNFDGETDLEGTNIGFVDSATLYDGECIIVDAWQNHAEVLRLQDDATAGEDPYIRHNITQATSGTHEFWIGTNDVTERWVLFLSNPDVGDQFVKVQITASKFQYIDSGGAWQDAGVAAANDTWYHIKIVWRADDTWDLYVDGVITNCNNESFQGAQGSGLYRLQLRCYGDSADYCYLDAYGEAEDSGYTVGDNQYIEEGESDKVVFEGIVDENTGRKIQMAKVLNQGSEMDEIEPTGEYTVDTDGLIDGIIDDFHDYITKGTRQDGADLGTITLKGNKKSRKYFNQIKDFDGYTWALRSQGALDYDDGSVSTDVALLYEKDDHEDDPIWDVDTIPISSGTNQVIVKGKINPTTGVPYEDQWDDEEDQRQFGIHKIVIIDALLDSNAKCLTKATAIGTREGGGYLTVKCSFRKPLLGVIYPHQTITFKYISEDISISQATYIIDGIGIDLLREVCFLQASTGLIFEYESIERELPEENAQKIEQNAETLTTKATVYVSASDPTVNEDVDSGYLDGDLWINSGDAGVFILIDNSSGAANWDELAKV